MTLSQQYNGEFERVAKSVVEFLFQGAGAQINQTKAQKDGGYDIIVQCTDGAMNQKIYFECKLRSQNLNLRDIAANTIIAFNEGAIGFVAMTNYNYTPQSDEQLSQFSKKTILNIKIMTGEEIRQIICTEKIPISSELYSLLDSKKSMRTPSSEMLRIDLNNLPVYRQFLHKEPPKSNGHIYNNNTQDYLINIFGKKCELLKNLLSQGLTVMVCGYSGVGKSHLISAVLNNHFQDGTYTKSIHINASLYETQTHFLRGLLIEIWGIPEEDLLNDLTAEQLQTICATLCGIEHDTKTEKILRKLLAPSISDIVHDQDYNFLICKYLISLLNVHRDINYIFHIDNLQFAQQETAVIIVYFMKQLHKYGIGCVVEYTNPEYACQTEYFQPVQLAQLQRIDIEILDNAHAIEYLCCTYPELSEPIAAAIVRFVGSRVSNLTLLVDFLSKKGIDLTNSEQISRELNDLTPNDIPNALSKVFPEYRKRHSKLFMALGLLHGSISYELLAEIDLYDEDQLEGLIHAKILAFENNCIVPGNEFIRQKFLEDIAVPTPKHAQLARQLLDALKKLPGSNPSAVIYLLYFLKQFKEAMEKIDEYTGWLHQERQYSTLIEYYDLAIEITAALRDYGKCGAYLVKQLQIIVIKKEITGDKAQKRIEELSALLKDYRLGEWQKTYQIAHDYFLGKRMFKLGRLSQSEKIFQTNRDHYERCIWGEYVDNTADWLGCVCCNYALYVKETLGNTHALTIFERARSVLKDSFELQREHYSHLACMQLYANPSEACTYYQKILSMFDEPPISSALPFHEYGDLAMSLLLAKKYQDAIDSATYAVERAQSYGVLDEVGRSLNIKGCAKLCIGETDAADDLFSEAIGVMEFSGYRMYCWRSRLNKIQLNLEKPLEREVGFISGRNLF